MFPIPPAYTPTSDRYELERDRIHRLLPNNYLVNNLSVNSDLVNYLHQISSQNLLE